MTRRIRLGLGSLACLLAVVPCLAQVPAPLADFIDQHCAACHNDVDREAGLDLTALQLAPADRKNYDAWVKIHDRVTAGEMPPASKPRPAAGALGTFTQLIARDLLEADRQTSANSGRAVLRRLNRYEYENVLRDLLGAPWLQLKEWLPEDGEAHRFNKVGAALDISHVQMSRYLAAAEYALREVVARSPTAPVRAVTRYYAREQPGIQVRMRAPFPLDRIAFPLIGTQAQPEVRARKAPITVGEGNPEIREREAMAVVHSNSDPVELRFNGFRAPIAGRYRLRVRAYSIWVGAGKDERWWVPDLNDISRGRRSEPITLYAEIERRMRRRIGSFDVGPEPTTGEFEVFLQQGETIRPDAARLFRSRPPNWRNPLATHEGMPGVAYQWLEVDGPIFETWPQPGHTLLFGALPITAAAAPAVLPEIAVANAADEARQRLRAFTARAYRRPVGESDALRYLPVVERALVSGRSFSQAMLLGYAGVLTSPEFLYVRESPGRLDSHALATRLALFLVNSAPDAELRGAADRGELQDPQRLHAEAEQLLRSPHSRRFQEAFLDYWLDLRKMDATAPDAALYPDYDTDELLRESASDETRAFFAALVDGDLPARNLIDSDFAFLNERLGQHYGIPQPESVQLRRVTLPEGSVRGGLLTQATVLKVTANGTTTSPVLRGVWILERILGDPPEPPPPGIPAVEPDTRGSTTIREQLERHRADASCASCHAKIDPPGFALESFDVFGGWRDRYRAVREGVEPVPGRGRDGQPFAFHYAQPVDSSGITADGRAFRDVAEFKRLLLADERAIARNLVRHLIVYATGAPVRFGDRPEVERILDRCAAGGYGVRSLLHAIVQSPLFLEK